MTASVREKVRARLGDGTRLPFPRGGLLQRKCACGGSSGLDGECAECQQKKLDLQRKQTGAEGPRTAPPIVHEVLSSPGHPLDREIRSLMEPRFGHDFGKVRVHTDSRAAESVKAVGALAYTVGQDVVFDTGQYAPHTPVGRRLLAHELTHVVQQWESTPGGQLFDSTGEARFEREAEQAEQSIDVRGAENASRWLFSETSPRSIRRAVRRENVSCRDTGLTNPNLSGADAVAAIESADAEAITLARRAELLLDVHLLFTEAGDPVDPDFDTILQEEFGLSLANPAHFPLIEQQRDRFARVRETLESGYLRYICRGDKVSLVGCQEGSCEGNRAFSCPGNRLIVLCQPFWEESTRRPGTILHEPFHIWFHMARHTESALRRADAFCFVAFAKRVAGEQAPSFSCKDHTNG